MYIVSNINESLVALRPLHSLAQGNAIHCVTRDIHDCREEKAFRMCNDPRVPERWSKMLGRSVKSGGCNRRAYSTNGYW